jgi:alpha-L-fucosidase
MVHFGLYSILEGFWKGEEMDYVGEWIQSRFRIPRDEYALLAGEFNPTGFDPDEWVAYAQAAGMRSMVVTAKHHDGFALFRSKADPFNCVEASPFGRDLVGELAESCRRAGLPFGLYYSQTLDWRERNGGGTNRYGLNKGMSWFNDWDFPVEGRNFDEYFGRKCLPQIEELLTQYGPLIEVWFDTPLEMAAPYSAKILETVRRIQPDCLVNSRLGGDFDFEITGDNMIPSNRMERPAEAPATLNHTWGYKRNDRSWKTPEEVIRTLSRLASVDVNYLLNVGPDGTGRFPSDSSKILGKVGAWLRANGEAIFGTRPSPFDARITWGDVTASERSLFFIVGPETAGRVCLDGLESTPEKSVLLPDRPVDWKWDANTLVLEIPPHEGRSVLRLDFPGPPRIRSGLYSQGGRLILDAPRGNLRDFACRDAGEKTVDADGNPSDESGPCFRRGMTFGWKTIETTLDWEIVLPETALWQIIAETGVAWHGQKWQEGIVVEVSCGNQKLVADLKWDAEDSSESARDYAHVTSRLGACSLPSGKSNLTLKALHLPEGGTGLHLIRVSLCREDLSSKVSSK